MDMTTQTGQHIINDLQFPEYQEILADKEHGVSFIRACVDKTGMTFADDLSITNYPNVESEQESGYSITGHLQESHISIHTWTKEQLFTFDLFSCNKFDMIDVVSCISEHFNHDFSASIMVIDRSTKISMMSVSKYNCNYNKTDGSCLVHKVKS